MRHRKLLGPHEPAEAGVQREGAIGPGLRGGGLFSLAMPCPSIIAHNMPLFVHSVAPSAVLCRPPSTFPATLAEPQVPWRLDRGPPGWTCANQGG
jgi:hypothetical protein